ncbi:MAG: ASPIC/UnbV domain-containing protein, partial [Nitrospinota bacterium]|nr:ASPIC/UnbV domain-containing protein [Nitrospinota bacterium]
QNGEKHQFREIKSGGGFHSYDAPEAHFGLSEFDIIKKIEITWSTGETTYLKGNFAVNHEYTVQRKS